MKRNATEENKGKDKKLVIQMSQEIWYKLKFLALENNTSMNQLCREGIDFIIKKYEKPQAKK